MSEKRHRKIGGGDIAKLVGMSPYGGPIDVFARIVEGADSEQTKVQKRGLDLEPFVRGNYVADTGAILRSPHPGTVFSPRYEFMAGTPDDIATVGGAELVPDYKTVAMSQWENFGEPGTDQIPTHYLIQLEWYMALLDLPAAHLAAQFTFDDLRIFVVRRDLELESMLIEAGERFWVDHVLTGKPPPVDASESYGGWLATKYPKPSKEILPADADAEFWVRRLRNAKANLAAAEALKTEADNRLKQAIGPAYGLKGDGWKAAWFPVQGRESTDWEAVATEAGVSADLIAKHTKRGAGWRDRKSVV